MADIRGPEITCVINVWNGETYLRQTIESLLQQTIPLDILVVDNCSTDSTPMIVSEYSSVKYTKTPRFMTLGEARGFSLNLVETELISWLDSDDLWDEMFCEYTLEVFRSFPSAQISCGGCTIIDPSGNPISSARQNYTASISAKKYIEADEPHLLAILLRPYASWCTYAFRLGAIKSVGGINERLKYCTDYDLISKIVLQYKKPSIFINRNIAKYRIHGNQLTNSLKIYEKMSEVQTVWENIIENKAAPTLQTLDSVSLFESRISLFQIKNSSESYYRKLSRFLGLFNRTFLRWVLYYVLMKFSQRKAIDENIAVIANKSPAFK